MINSSINAQQKLDSVNTYNRFGVSYCIGGQVYNDNFIYKPGISVQYSYGLKLNEVVGVGLGLGFQSFQHEQFLPLYLEVMGYKKKKKNTPVLEMQFGYAPCWYSGSMNLKNYEYHGGVFFNAGVGSKFHVNGPFSVIFHISYRHQFARLEYEIFETDTYSELLNYDMIVLSLSLIKEK